MVTEMPKGPERERRLQEQKDKKRKLNMGSKDDPRELEKDYTEYKKIFKKNQQDTDNLFNLCFICEELGRYNEALDYWQVYFNLLRNEDRAARIFARNRIKEIKRKLGIE